MTNKQHITPTQVQHIANLAQIPISQDETRSLSDAFEETLTVIENLKTIDVANVETTHQVTNLENILRADEVNTERMFTQEEALANAPQVFQGYFVVPRLIDTESTS